MIKISSNSHYTKVVVSFKNSCQQILLKYVFCRILWQIQSIETKINIKITKYALLEGCSR